MMEDGERKGSQAAFNNKFIESHVDSQRVIYDRLPGSQIIKRIEPIDRYKLLTEVSLVGHGLESISNLKDLQSLAKLNLSWNSISDFSHLTEIASLVELHISHNRITSIPLSISSLQKLRIFRISYNYLEDRNDLLRLKPLINLSNLDIEGNPLSSDPDSLLFAVFSLPHLSILNRSGISIEYRRQAAERFERLQIEDLSASNRQLSQKVKDLTQKVKDLTLEHSSRGAEISLSAAGLQAKINELIKRADQQSIEIARKDGEISTLKASIEKTRTKMESDQSQMNKIKLQTEKEINSNKMEKDRYQMELETLQKENERLKKGERMFIEQKRNFDERIQEMLIVTLENSKLKESVQDLRAINQKQSEFIEDLQKELLSQKSAVSQKSPKAAEQTSLRIAQERIKDLESQNSSLLESLKSNEPKYDVQSELNEKDSMIEKLEKENEMLRDAQMKSVSELKEKLNEAQKKSHSDIKAQNEMQKMALKEKDDKIAETSEEIKAQKQMINSMKEEFYEIAKTVAGNEVQHKEFNDIVSVIRSNLAQYSIMEQKLKKEKQKVKSLKIELTSTHANAIDIAKNETNTLLEEENSRLRKEILKEQNKISSLRQKKHNLIGLKHSFQRLSTEITGEEQTDPIQGIRNAFNKISEENRRLQTETEDKKYNEIESLKLANNTLQGTAIRSEKAANEAKEELKHNENEFQRYKEKYEADVLKANQKLKELSATIQLLRESADAKEKSLGDTKHLISDIKSRESSLQNELKAAHQRIEELEAENSELSAKIVSLNKDISENTKGFEREISELNGKILKGEEAASISSKKLNEIGSIQASLLASQKELNEVIQKLNEKEKELKESEEQKENILKRLIELEPDSMSKSDEEVVDKFSQKCRENSRTITDQYERIQSYERELLKAKKMNEEITNEMGLKISGLENENQKLNQNIIAQKHKIKEMENKNVKIEADLNAQIEKLKTSEEVKASLDQRIQALEDENQKLESSDKTQTEKAKIYEDENRTLQLNISEQIRKVRSLEAADKNSISIQIQKIATLEESIEKMKEELRAQIERAEKAEEGKRKSDQNNAIQTQEIQKIGEENRKLSSNLKMQIGNVKTNEEEKKKLVSDLSNQAQKIQAIENENRKLNAMLNGQNQKIQNDSNQFSNDLMAYKQQIESLEQENHKILLDFETKSHKVVELEDENRKLTENLSNEIEKARNADSKMAGLQKAFEDRIRLDLGLRNSQIESLQTKLNKCNSDLSAASNREKELLAQIESQTMTIAKTSEECQQAKVDLRKREDEIHSLQNELNSEKEVKETQRKAMEKFEADFSSASEREKNLISLQSKKIESLQARLIEASNIMSAHQAETENSKGEISKIMSEANDKSLKYEAEISRLRKELAQSQLECSKSQFSAKQQAERVRQISEEKNETEKKLLNSVKEQTSLQNQLLSEESQNEAMSKSLNSGNAELLEKNVKSHQITIMQKDQDIIDLRMRIHALETEKDELRNQNEVQKREIERFNSMSTVSSKIDNIKALKMQLNKAKTNASDFEEETKKKELEIRTLNDGIKEAQNQIHEMKKLSEKFDIEIAGKNLEIENLKKNQDENNKMKGQLIENQKNCDELNIQLGQKNIEIDELKKARSELAKLKDQYEIDMKPSVKMNNQIQQMNSQIEVLRKEKNSTAELQMQIDSSQKITKELENQIGQKNSEISDLNKKIEKREKENIILRRQIEDQTKSAGEMEIKIRSANTSIVSLEEEIRQKDNQFEKSLKEKQNSPASDLKSSQIQKLVTDLIQKEHENQMLRLKLGSEKMPEKEVIFSNISAQTDPNDDPLILKQRIESLELEKQKIKNSLSAEVKNLQKEVKDTQQRLSVITKSKVDDTSKAKETEAQVRSQKEKNLQLENRVEELTKVIEDAKLASEQKDNEAEALIDQIRQEREQLENLKEENKRISSKLNQTMAEYEAKGISSQSLQKEADANLDKLNGIIEKIKQIHDVSKEFQFVENSRQCLIKLFESINPLFGSIPLDSIHIEFSTLMEVVPQVIASISPSDAGEASNLLSTLKQDLLSFPIPADLQSFRDDSQGDKRLAVQLEQLRSLVTLVKRLFEQREKHIEQLGTLIASQHAAIMRLSSNVVQ